MVHIVAQDDNRTINIAPTTVVEEVMQNIWAILNTPKYSCPLDRDLGLEQRFVDKPSPDIAYNIMVSEVLDEIEASEPRAVIENITYRAGNQLGHIIPVLEVSIDESR